MTAERRVDVAVVIDGKAIGFKAAGQTAEEVIKKLKADAKQLTAVTKVQKETYNQLVKEMKGVIASTEATAEATKKDSKERKESTAATKAQQEELKRLQTELRQVKIELLESRVATQNFKKTAEDTARALVREDIALKGVTVELKKKKKEAAEAALSQEKLKESADEAAVSMTAEAMAAREAADGISKKGRVSAMAALEQRELAKAAQEAFRFMSKEAIAAKLAAEAIDKKGDESAETARRQATLAMASAAASKALENETNVLNKLSVRMTLLRRPLLAMAVIFGTLASSPIASLLANIGAAAGGLLSQLIPLTGLLAAWPAIMFAVAGGIGVVLLASKRIKNELKSAFLDRFKEIKQRVGDEVLPGLVDGIHAVRDALFPLERVAVRFARVMGQIFSNTGQFLGSQQFRADFEKFGTFASVLLGRMARGGLDFARALENISMAALPLVDFLSRGFVSVADAFAEWTDKARRDGTLNQFFRDARISLTQIVDLTKNLVGIFAALFRAWKPLGNEMMVNLIAITTEWNKFLGSTKGQNGLTDFMNSSRPAMIEMNRLLGAMAVALGRMALDGQDNLARIFRIMRVDLLPIIENLSKNMNEKVLPAVLDILEALLKLFRETEPGWTAMLDAVQPVADVLVAIVDLIAQLTNLMPGITKIIPALLFGVGALAGWRALVALTSIILTNIKQAVALKIAENVVDPFAAGAGSRRGTRSAFGKGGARRTGTTALEDAVAGAGGGAAGAKGSGRIGKLANKAGRLIAPVVGASALTLGVGAAIGTGVLGAGVLAAKTPKNPIPALGNREATPIPGRGRPVRTGGAKKEADDERKSSVDAARAVDSLRESFKRLASNQGIGAAASRMADLNDQFGQLPGFTDAVKGLTDLKLGKAFEAALSQVRRFSKGASSSFDDWAANVRLNARLINKTLTGDLRLQAMVQNFRAAIDNISSSFEAGKVSSRTFVKAIRRNMQDMYVFAKNKSVDTKVAVAKQFDASANAIQRAMNKGLISTRKGMSLIEDLMRKKLALFGITGKEASRYLNGQDTKTGKTDSSGASGNAGAGAATGFIGNEGQRGADKHHLVVGDGEAVVNAPQQGIINTGLRAIGLGGGLRDVFRATRGKRHPTASPGAHEAPIAAAGGFGGPMGARPGFGPVNVLANKMGLQMTSGYRSYDTVAGAMVSDHVSGDAGDFSNGVTTPQEDAFNAFWLKLPQVIKQLIWRGKDQFRGFPIADHFNHVHVALNRQFGDNAGLTAQVIDAASQGLDLGALLAGVGGATGAVASWSDIKSPEIDGAGLIGAYAQRAVDIVTAAANDKGTSIVSSLGGGLNGNGSVNPNGAFDGQAWTGGTGASVFGGYGGYRGKLRPGGAYYAELSDPAGSLNFSALGGLPEGFAYNVTYKGKTVRATKEDVGAGGGPVQGQKRRIDLHQDLANLLGFGNGLDIVDLQPAALGWLFDQGMASPAYAAGGYDPNNPNAAQNGAPPGGGTGNPNQTTPTTDAKKKPKKEKKKKRKATKLERLTAQRKAMLNFMGKSKFKYDPAVSIMQDFLDKGIGNVEDYDTRIGLFSGNADLTDEQLTVGLTDADADAMNALWFGPTFDKSRVADYFYEGDELRNDGGVWGREYGRRGPTRNDDGWAAYNPELLQYNGQYTRGVPQRMEELKGLHDLETLKMVALAWQVRDRARSQKGHVKRSLREHLMAQRRMEHVIREGAYFQQQLRVEGARVEPDWLKLYPKKMVKGKDINKTKREKAKAKWQGDRGLKMRKLMSNHRQDLQRSIQAESKGPGTNPDVLLMLKSQLEQFQGDVGIGEAARLEEEANPPKAPKATDHDKDGHPDPHDPISKTPKWEDPKVRAGLISSGQKRAGDLNEMLWGDRTALPTNEADPSTPYGLLAAQRGELLEYNTTLLDTIHQTVTADIPQALLDLRVTEKEMFETAGTRSTLARLPEVDTSTDSGDSDLANLKDQMLQEALQNLAVSQSQFATLQGFNPLVGQRLVGAFEHGGPINKTGMALVHEGEYISTNPKGPYGSQIVHGGGGGDVHVSISLGEGHAVDISQVRAEIDGRAAKVVSEQIGKNRRIIASAPGGTRRPF